MLIYNYTVIFYKSLFHLKFILRVFWNMITVTEGYSWSNMILETLEDRWRIHLEKYIFQYQLSNSIKHVTT